MTAPAAFTCDDELVLRLLPVLAELSAIQDAAPPERQLLVDGVLVAASEALSTLGFGWPDDGEATA